MNHRERLIIFTRYPEPGTTKTRLMSCLGSRGAADLQRQMTAHVLAQAAPLKALRGLALEVRYEGGNHRLMQAWLGDQMDFVRQGEGDIGRRMKRAFREAMERGSDSVVLIGSDIPGIATALLENAFAKLGDKPVVLGPATDGGYYLIGLSRQGLAWAAAEIFTDMDWGTSAVLPETCRRLRQKGVDFFLLAPLDDVDRPEDLPVWERCRRR
jgi:rSAM/selenodomain-associated transferase 1